MGQMGGYHKYEEDSPGDIVRSDKTHAERFTRKPFFVSVWSEITNLRNWRHLISFQLTKKNTIHAKYTIFKIIVSSFFKYSRH